MIGSVCDVLLSRTRRPADHSVLADAELNLRQPDFCTFRSIRTLCISWNIDASRPQDLAGTPQNFDFLRDVLLSVDSPDIISFGFQEMVSAPRRRDELSR